MIPGAIERRQRDGSNALGEKGHQNQSHFHKDVIRKRG